MEKSFNPSQVFYKLEKLFDRPSTSKKVSIPHRYSTNLNRLVDIILDKLSFNPSQVFYKLKNKKDCEEFLEKFQSLIGILQTKSFFIYLLPSLSVSIPHRYSTNPFSLIALLQASSSFNPSQVFYKLVTDCILHYFTSCFNPSQVFYKLDEVDVIVVDLPVFQSLIGILQTYNQISFLSFLLEFQSLIGILQTEKLFAEKK